MEPRLYRSASIIIISIIVIVVLQQLLSYSLQTSGLLGTRDGNKANDFMTPDGQVVSSTQDIDIYRSFALKCKRC